MIALYKHNRLYAAKLQYANITKNIRISRKNNKCRNDIIRNYTQIVQSAY